ncbi:MAG: nucleotidyl transferase AbiEii/AbiGii toxin family protein, partial [Bifidobacteriaceae bacterium]|jgi:hypothetical protein|nr:nucleotidyl transferase AbiEii/AbiGii toxin family protein [Bifidobacteriaceae bacterium]
VADKLCATITEYHGKPSSREKDLVDLVIIALTQPMPADRLREAIITECRKRHLAAAAAFMIPSTWGKAYPTLARNTTAQTCDLKAAASLMAQFLDPVLGGSASGMWHPQTRAWQ